MTASSFAAMKMVASGGMPFAHSGTTISPGNVSGSGFCVPDGFGTSFDAAPADDGSNMVQRGQMNYIGRIASFSPFFFQAGGYYTFDPSVATGLEVDGVKGIDGYPKGALLWMVDGYTLIPVLSLVDNNKVDFTGLTNTTTYTDVTNGAIDGENWQALVMNEGVTDAITLADVDLGEIDAITKLTTISMNAASFVLPRGGAVSVAMTLGEIVSGGEGSACTYSATLYFKKPGDLESTSIILVGGGESSSLAAEAIKLPSGTLCSIILHFGLIHFKSVNLKVTLV